VFEGCFPAGTRLDTPEGPKCIEQFRVGDAILARDEFTPGRTIGVQSVEEVFVRTGRVWEVTVAGEVIRVTPEHPFYVLNHDEWRAVGALAVGDVLVSEAGQPLLVENLHDTGRYETVYNVRVSEWHTYFVAADSGRWSVWSHNTCYELPHAPVLNSHGVPIDVIQSIAAETRMTGYARGIIPETGESLWLRITSGRSQSSGMGSGVWTERIREGMGLPPSLLTSLTHVEGQAAYVQFTHGIQTMTVWVPPVRTGSASLLGPCRSCLPLDSALPNVGLILAPGQQLIVRGGPLNGIIHIFRR
jgi:hypothetical protein